MVELTDLWLPVLLSAVFVFIVSSIIHMALPFHKSDLKKLPGEDTILQSIRDQKVAPGTYMFPHASSMKEMASPEMIKKYNEGPIGQVTIKPSGQPAMGKSLVQWFIYLLVISFFVAYITRLALSAGAEYKEVHRVAGTVAILGYATYPIYESVWKGQAWKVSFKYMIDGVIFGLVTGGTFGWLWP